MDLDIFFQKIIQESQRWSNKSIDLHSIKASIRLKKWRFTISAKTWKIFAGIICMLTLITFQSEEENINEKSQDERQGSEVY